MAKRAHLESNWSTVWISKTKSFSNLTAKRPYLAVSLLCDCSSQRKSILLKPSSGGERSTDMIVLVIAEDEVKRKILAQVWKVCPTDLGMRSVAQM